MSWQWSLFITVVVILSWPVIVIVLYRRLEEMGPALIMGSLVWLSLFGLGGLGVALFHALRGAQGCG